VPFGHLRASFLPRIPGRLETVSPQISRNYGTLKPPLSAIFSPSVNFPFKWTSVPLGAYNYTWHRYHYLDSEPSILIHEAAFALLKSLHGCFRPPICQCTVLAVVSSVLIKAVANFMTSDSSETSEIEKIQIIRIIAVGIKGGELKYSSREDDLVSRRIVIRVPSLLLVQLNFRLYLGCHSPLFFIDRFTR